MRTSRVCHVIQDPTNAVTAKKETSIKFSSAEKSVSEFIWAANKEIPTLIIFEPRSVLALPSTLSARTVLLFLIPIYKL